MVSRKPACPQAAQTLEKQPREDALAYDLAAKSILIHVPFPYTIFFLIFWSGFFILWTFVLDLPVGPGSPTYYNP